MSRRRPRLPPVALLVGLASIIAAIVGLLRQGAEEAPEATPLPSTVCSGPQVGVHSTLAFTPDAARREQVVAAVDEYLQPQVVRKACSGARSSRLRAGSSGAAWTA